MEKPQYYANLAYKFLKSCKAYSTNKKIISSLFNKKIGNLDYKEIIQLRLAMIDKFYSTRLNNKEFQLELIADKIHNISKNGKDLEFMKLCSEYLKNLDYKCKIRGLLEQKYGSKKAPSAITKYIYFLTNFRFPIYDSIVIKIAPPFCKKLGFKAKGFTTGIVNYIKAMSKLKEEVKTDFCKLDNLLWLIGKIREESYFSILGHEKHNKLKDTCGRNDVRGMMGNNNRKRKLLNVFNEKQLEFIDFSLDLI